MILVQQSWSVVYVWRGPVFQHELICTGFSLVQTAPLRYLVFFLCADQFISASGVLLHPKHKFEKAPILPRKMEVCRSRKPGVLADDRVDYIEHWTACAKWNLLSIIHTHSSYHGLVYCIVWLSNIYYQSNLVASPLKLVACHKSHCTKSRCPGFNWAFGSSQKAIYVRDIPNYLICCSSKNLLFDLYLIQTAKLLFTQL